MKKMEMRCLQNMRKELKPLVLMAVEKTGADVIWSDEADERLKGTLDEDNYGSVWSAQPDLSEFWRVYDQLKA